MQRMNADKEQALNYMKAMALVALVLALMHLQNFPTEFRSSPMIVQNKIGIALSMIKFQA